MRRDMKKIGQHVVLFLCIRNIWLCFFEIVDCQYEKIIHI